MSRGSILSPEGLTRVGAVRVPGTTLRAPNLRQPRFDRAPRTGDPLGGAGQALQRIGNTLLKRDEVLRRSVQARQVTEGASETNLAVQAAIDAAAQVKPEDAEDTYEEALQSHFSSISNNEGVPEDTTAILQSQFTATANNGLITVRAQLAQRQQSMQQAAVITSREELLDAVRLGADPQTTKDSFVDLMELNSDAFAVDEIAQAVVDFDNKADAASLEFETGQLMSQIARSIETFESNPTDHSRLVLEDFLSSTIDDLVERQLINVRTGVLAQTNFKKALEGVVTDKFQDISSLAISMQRAGDIAGLEGLRGEADAMEALDPDKHRLAITDISSRITALDKAAVKGSFIIDLYNGTATGDIPQGRDELNAAYRLFRNSGGDVPNFARFLTLNNSDFPPEMTADIERMTEPGTVDLPMLQDVLQAVGPKRANDLIAASSDPNLAKATLAANESELELLSDSRASTELETASVHYFGDKLVDQKIKTMKVHTVIQEALDIKIKAPSSEVQAEFQARYYIRYAEQAISLGQSGQDSADRSDRAEKAAAQDIARAFENFGGTLVRKELVEGLDIGRLKRAVNLGTDQPPEQITGTGFDRDIQFTQRAFAFVSRLFTDTGPQSRLDLIKRIGGTAFVPIVGDLGVTQFIAISEDDYKVKRINQGTTQFDALLRGVRANAGPFDLLPLHDLQHREQYGVTSISEYDQQNASIEDGFGMRLARHVYSQLASVGLFQDLTPDQIKKLVQIESLKTARRLGWANVVGGTTEP